MAKVNERKRLKLQADRLAGAIVRARGYCELAGIDNVRCGGTLQWAHIVGRANHRLRWELWNALCLCAGHHVYYTHHPWEWNELIRSRFPEQYRLIEQHRNELFDGNLAAVVERLKEQENGED